MPEMSDLDEFSMPSEHRRLLESHEFNLTGSRFVGPVVSSRLPVGALEIFRGSDCFSVRQSPMYSSKIVTNGTRILCLALFGEILDPFTIQELESECGQFADGI